MRLLCDDPDSVAGGRRELIAPGGVRVLIAEAHPVLETPPTETELREVLTLLSLSPRQLLRTGEAAYSEAGLADTALSDEQLQAKTDEFRAFNVRMNFDSYG